MLTPSDADKVKRQLEEDKPLDLVEVVGGPLGMLETSLPALAFVVAYLISGSDTNVSAITAVAVAFAFAIARLVRRQTPRHALTGLAGVAFAAFIASVSGDAKNYFLPGLLLNVGYAAAFIVSALVKWPLIGVVVGQVEGEGTAWRDDPIRYRRYLRATWLWAGLFGLRLAVQLPLYLANAVVILGVARTAMGVPLLILGIWLTWLMVVKAKPAAPKPAGA